MQIGLTKLDQFDMTTHLHIYLYFFRRQHKDKLDKKKWGKPESRLDFQCIFECINLVR